MPSADSSLPPVGSTDLSKSSVAAAGTDCSSARDRWRSRFSTSSRCSGERSISSITPVSTRCDRTSMRFSRSRSRSSWNFASCSALSTLASPASIAFPRVARSSMTGTFPSAVACTSSISRMIAPCWSIDRPSASVSRSILASSRDFGPRSAWSAKGKSLAFTSFGRLPSAAVARVAGEMRACLFPTAPSSFPTAAGESGASGFSSHAVENPTRAARAGKIKREWFMRGGWR